MITEKDSSVKYITVINYVNIGRDHRIIGCRVKLDFNNETIGLLQRQHIGIFTEIQEYY